MCVERETREKEKERERESVCVCVYHRVTNNLLRVMTEKRSRNAKPVTIRNNALSSWYRSEIWHEKTGQSEGAEEL